MNERCRAEGCAETAVAVLEDRPVCRKHFLTEAYRHLESVSSQISSPQFHELHGDSARRFLEDCMRQVADIACAPHFPDNLERARLLDILLWASELHGRLRRSERVSARVPLLVRLKAPDRSWEEQTETATLSRHGMQVTLRGDPRPNDLVVCTRLDNGWKADARVAWVRPLPSGENEAGLEFLSGENFWGLGSSGVASSRKA